MPKCSDKDDLLNQVTGETRVHSCYLMKKHSMQTALVRERRVRATSGQYGPDALGYTRAAMLDAIRCNSEKRSQSHNI